MRPASPCRTSPYWYWAPLSRIVSKYGGMRAELVRQFDVLGGIVAETIHAVGHGLLEESLHAVADFLVLGVEIPQAEQVAVGHLPTIAVIDCGAVIPASSFGVVVE